MHFYIVNDPAKYPKYQKSNNFNAEFLIDLLKLDIPSLSDELAFSRKKNCIEKKISTVFAIIHNKKCVQFFSQSDYYGTFACLHGPFLMDEVVVLCWSFCYKKEAEEEV